MPEPSNQASLQRRANWVGLRTLRQRPKLVGATPAGEPVYDVRSVRLVLRGLSPHFDRLAPCSRCGKEVPASPVLSVADLERPLRPVICTDCVRGTGVSTFFDTSTRPPALEREPEPPEPVEMPAPAPAAVMAVADAPNAERTAMEERLALFERHLRAVTDRVNQLGHDLWADRAATEERGRTEEAEVRSALDRLGEELAAVAGVGGQVDSQQAELAAALSAVAEIRSEIERLSEANLELARANQDLERRAATKAPMSPYDPAAEMVAAQEELAEAHRELARRLADVEAPAAPADLSQIRRQVADGVAEVERRLAARLEAQRRDLEAAIEDSIRGQRAGVGQMQHEMAEGQADLRQRLDALSAQLAQGMARMDAHAAWAASTTDRLDEFEERLERALLASPPAFWEAVADTGQAAPDGSAGGLLDALERQLHAASTRLAARTERAPAES